MQAIIKYITPIFCLFCLASLAVAQAPEVRVEVHTLARDAVKNELQLSGNLRALNEAQLSVSVSALVQSIHVDVGRRVEQGDLLLTLDSVIAEQESARARAGLATAEIALADSERLLKEALQMKNQSHISETEVRARENALRLSEAQLVEAQAASSIADAQLARHRLFAPFAGVITGRHTELGQWLEPGGPAFTLVSLTQLYLDVQLPQEYFADTEHISIVTIHPDSHPEVSIPAEVDVLVPVGGVARSFSLRLRTADPSDLLFPGMSAVAKLVFERPEQALLLPRDALLRNVDGNHSVFVIKGNQAVRRSVQLGGRHNDHYWVQGGLQEGDRVVVRGNELLSDKQTVTVVDTKAKNSSENGAGLQP